MVSFMMCDFAVNRFFVEKSTFKMNCSKIRSDLDSMSFVPPYNLLSPPSHLLSPPLTPSLLPTAAMADKEFINSPKNCVSDSLSGLLSTSPSLTRIKTHPHCIITTNLPNTVPLISGGGSGHEPAHVGYVAKGMLSGAVCGGCFASPSINEILATILSLTTIEKPSCLLIVKNYTGDVLNFTLAAKKANTIHGRDVKIVVVADDCAVPLSKGITGRRGVAGTIFVHKCAGAVADAGGSIDEVVGTAEMIKNRLLSLGVSLTGVTIPGQPAPKVRKCEERSDEH